jgi:hypothetical protein
MGGRLLLGGVPSTMLSTSGTGELMFPLLELTKKWRAMLLPVLICNGW